MNGRVEKILIANRSIRKMFLECKEHVTRKFDFQKNRTTVKKRPRGEDKVEMRESDIVNGDGENELKRMR